MAKKVNIKGCRVSMATAARDVSATDFRITHAAPVANGANWDVAFTLDPEQIGDVANITSANSAQVLMGAGSAILVNPIAGNGAGNLVAPFTALPQVAGNTGNVWQINYNNIVVVAKTGETITIPQLSVKIKSPF